jgi:hypothetical protein
MEERIKLAIKFEKERKNDIIKLLEYFGGKNNICGGFPGDTYCYIDLDGNINAMLSWNSRIMQFDRFDYSEFIKKIQFIPGDKVTVNLPGFEEHSEKEVGRLIWNSKSKAITYSMRCEDEGKEIYSPDVLDPVVKEVTVNNIENLLGDKKISSINFQDQKHYSDEVELCLSDQHEIKEKNGKWFVVKKKPELPKTYEECCRVLGIADVGNGYCGYKWKLLGAFQELLICRDAYWKLVGDWKPDFLNPTKEIRYFLFCTGTTIENGQGLFPTNKILIFPTEEMRDVFYENFKDLIEKCKELL